MPRGIRSNRKQRGRSSLRGLTSPLGNGSCLNQRTIVTACRALSPRGGLAGDEIRCSELFEALWFLELLIVSSHITYDGTLPTKDLGELEGVLDSFSDASRNPRSNFFPIAPSNEEEKTGIIQASAQQAIRTFVDLSPEGELDRPLPEADATRFFEELQKIDRFYRSIPDDDLESVVVHEVAQSYQRKSFRGSKCVSGIASLGAAGVEAVMRSAESSRAGSGLAAATLINRFRFFYVRNLSYGSRDVYVPAQRWKTLSERQALSFQEFFRNKLEERVRSAPGAFPQMLRNASFLNDVPLPPLGLYALMTTRTKNSPEAVARNARELFRSYGKVFRKFWEFTGEAPAPQDGWGAVFGIHATGDSTLDEHHEKILALFHDRFGSLQEKAYGRPAGSSSLTRKFIVPVGMGLATSAATAVLPLSELPTALNIAVSATIGGATSGIQEAMLGMLDVPLQSHVDQYRELERLLLTDPSLEGVMRTVSDQVEHVLGRRLVPG